MQIPSEITGKHKIRDFDICRLYIDGFTPDEICDKRKLRIGPRRVQQILYTNSKFVNPRVAWPKSKRIHMLQRIASKMGPTVSDKKDILDVLEQLRKEIEGDKAVIDQSTHRHLTVVLQEMKEKKKIENGNTNGHRNGKGYILSESQAD